MMKHLLEMEFSTDDVSELFSALGRILSSDCFYFTAYERELLNNFYDWCEKEL